MYQQLVGRIWKTHQPKVMYVVGRRGKSMASAAIAAALRNSGVDMKVLHHVNDLAKDAGTLQQTSLMGAWWKYVVKKQAYPALLCIEAGKGINTPAAAHVWPTAAQTTVILCAFADTYQESRQEIELYVRNELALFLDQAKSVHLIYDADVPHLSDIVADLGFGQQTTISFERPSDIQALSVDVLSGDASGLDARWAGVHAKLRLGGSTLPFLAYGGVGRSHVRAAMYAVAAAEIHGVNAIDALQALRSYSPLPGRMALVPGVKKTMLIDDTYDSDPFSLQHALQDVAALPLPKEHKRIAVIGDLANAGADSEALHAAVGEMMVTMPYQTLVAVGEQAADIARGARAAGFDEQSVFHYTDKEEAGKFVQKILKKGDLVLIKGSSALKLETVVKELMAFPLKAKTDLLQR